MPSLQKFAIRQIKGVSNSANAGKGNEEDLGEEEEGEREGKGKAFAATKLNPLYFTAYGTMMLTSRSYQSAICESTSRRSIAQSYLELTGLLQCTY